MKNTLTWISFLVVAVLFSPAEQVSAQMYNSNVSNSSIKLKIKRGNGWGGFHLININGNVFLGGDYRYQINTLKSGYREELESGNFTGEINLNTISYLFHPNFLLIDFGVGYAPGTRSDNFLVAPDRTDTRTSERINLGITLFNTRPISLDTYANYRHGFVNRELTSDVESYQYNIGASLSFKNDILPLNLNYLHDRWEQEEIQTKRIWDTRRDIISGQIIKDFSNWNKNELVVSYNDYYRKYAHNTAIKNIISKLKLMNKFLFNGDMQNQYNSIIWFNNQSGDEPFDRLQINQELFLKTLTIFDIRGRYQYSKFDNYVVESKQHNVGGEVSHQLFRSLKTFVNYEYNDMNQTFFSEQIQRANIGLNYRKEIPTGTLRLDYTYRYQKNDRISEPSNLKVINEEHLLIDDEITLLDNPRVILSSIVVTDETGTIIYDENLDYLLIPRGEYTELDRIPGGQIPDGGLVYVDYESEFRADYKFTANGNSFSVGLSILQNLFDFYFTYNDFDYSNIQGEGIFLTTLKFFNQKLFGAKTRVSFVTVGFEYDDYKSNITPYRSLRYYLDMSDIFFQRLLVSLSLSYRDYLLVGIKEKQIYKDGTGRISYSFSSKTKFKFVAYTRLQNGRQIDLDLYSFRTEFETMLRDITIVLGFENFYRNYISEQVNYNNIYLRIGRRF